MSSNMVIRIESIIPALDRLAADMGQPFRSRLIARGGNFTVSNERKLRKTKFTKVQWLTCWHEFWPKKHGIPEIVGRQAQAALD